MAELGYSLEWQVLDSQDFGVPQHRERVFLIGHLDEEGRGFRKVFPFATDHPKADELRRQRTVANCLDTRIEGNTRGTYPTDNGGGGEGQRLSQGIVLKKGNKPKLTNIAGTLDTRIGALPNFAETYVMEK